MTLCIKLGPWWIICQLFFKILPTVMAAQYRMIGTCCQISFLQCMPGNHYALELKCEARMGTVLDFIIYTGATEVLMVRKLILAKKWFEAYGEVLR